VSSDSETETETTAETEADSPEGESTPKKKKRRSFFENWNGLFGKPVKSEPNSPEKIKPKVIVIQADVHTNSNGESSNNTTNHNNTEERDNTEQTEQAEMEELRKTLTILTRGINFSGSPTEDILVFIKQYENEGTVQGWDNAKLADNFANVLRGKALENYLNSDVNKKDWPQVKAEMRLMYQKNPLKVKKMLEEMKYSEEDNFFSYVSDFTKLMEQMDDTVTDKEFLEKIRPTLPLEMQKFLAGREIDTKKQLMSEYKNWVKYRKNIPGTDDELT